MTKYNAISYDGPIIIRSEYDEDEGLFYLWNDRTDEELCDSMDNPLRFEDETEVESYLEENYLSVQEI